MDEKKMHKYSAYDIDINEEIIAKAPVKYTDGQVVDVKFGNNSRKVKILKEIE